MPGECPIFCPVSLTLYHGVSHRIEAVLRSRWGSCLLPGITGQVSIPAGYFTGQIFIPPLPQTFILWLRCFQEVGRSLGTLPANFSQPNSRLCRGACKSSRVYPTVLMGYSWLCTQDSFLVNVNMISKDSIWDIGDRTWEG